MVYVKSVLLRNEHLINMNNLKNVLVFSVVYFMQAAHSTCGDGEYNLRSRTVICGSCGQPSDRNAGSCVSASSGVSSVSRSFTSGGGGGLPEGLVSHSHFIMGNEKPRQVQYEQYITI